jgi:hypothetical protein
MNEPTILQAIYDEQREHTKKIDKLVKDVSVLKVKSGLWGSLSGALAAGIALLGESLFRR